MSAQQYAKRVIGAERGSLFVVNRDSETGELLADAYEEGIDSDASDQMYKKTLPIQINSYPGIAADVVKSGIAIIINDTSTNPRFDREMDQSTGIVTKTILCAPINARDGVIGTGI